MRWLYILALASLTTSVQAQDTGTTAEDHDADGMMEELTLETAPFRQDIEITCSFVYECVESEPCSKSDFAPEITGNAGGLTPNDLVVQSYMRTDGEMIELIGVKSNMALSLSGGSFAARHLMSIAADGTTRYTVHYADGPTLISYLGTCN
tara:strand:- start:968 stop:1420 length:453 start_codon:yes stop_codon:yes gene_type:complete